MAESDTQASLAALLQLQSESTCQMQCMGSINPNAGECTVLAKQRWPLCSATCCLTLRRGLPDSLAHMFKC